MLRVGICEHFKTSCYSWCRYLYTWGEGRISAEGEKIPVRVEPIQLDYIDGMLLLPLIIEHTIDERSPLCGHTYASLTQMNAEIVVTFEGTTEVGQAIFNSSLSNAAL